MDIIFDKYEENSEIARKEIEFTLSFEGAIPSQESIKKEISVCYGVSPDLIALGRLGVVRGRKKAKGRARIYSDTVLLKKFEKH
ncbi:MAG: hypothetical protein PHP13_04030 [Methanomicrobium sp.]|nr:hypothetical protein [Methanomicrobium sp.]MDD4300082.1 hypothetical protein [Methanomicrobium sp.]